ncbi:MAG: PfkB family carbohydrate kinase, partial [Acidothermaceae bacterium]
AAWQHFAESLSLSGPPAVVVTLGGAGAIAAEKGVSFTVPAFDVEAVDSTGAGDAFCGAVAAALAAKNSLHEAVRRGCAAGALATTAVGAQAALPRGQDLDDLMSSRGGE